MIEAWVDCSHYIRLPKPFESRDGMLVKSIVRNLCRSSSLSLSYSVMWFPLFSCVTFTDFCLELETEPATLVPSHRQAMDSIALPFSEREREKKERGKAKA